MRLGFSVGVSSYLLSDFFRTAFLCFSISDSKSLGSCSPEGHVTDFHLVSPCMERIAATDILFLTKIDSLAKICLSLSMVYVLVYRSLESRYA